MQTAMDKLAGFLERRRLLVLGVWVALLVAAAPFAARQTEHQWRSRSTRPWSA